LDTTLRKAAVLIDTLDPVAARILLDRMPASDAARIHQARNELENVSPAERRQVICEFNEENSSGLAGVADGDDAETSPALSLLRAEPIDELMPGGQHSAATTAKPFAFLDGADSAALVRHLLKEDSHKVAVVLCHLPPQRAAEVLKQLPDSKRIDVVIRMSNIDELTPETVCNIESELRELLHKQQSSTGFGAILSIMESVDTWSRGEIIEQLRTEHSVLAEQLCESMDRHSDHVNEASKTEQPSAPFEETSELPDQASKELEAETGGYQFDDLVQLDGHSLAVLIQEADPDEVLLALTGATPWMVNRLLGQLPPREEKRLRQKMDRCGPLALKDIEVAQQKLLQLTSQLASEARINPPARRPFTSLA